MKIVNIGLGLGAGMIVSAIGISMKVPQPVIYGVSAAVTAGIIVTLNRRG